MSPEPDHGVFLLTYGVAVIVGNFLAGAAVARHPYAAFGVAGTLIAVATLALPSLGQWNRAPSHC